LQHKEGKFDTNYNNYRFAFHGLPFEISKVILDKEELPVTAWMNDGVFNLVIEKDFTEVHIL
jgi:alpha-glucosidase